MQTMLYVKVGDVATYELFKNVCDREGTSASAKIMEMIQAYMAGHGEGNPQTILDYAGEFRTLPKWKTCIYSHGIRVQGEIFCQPIGRRGYNSNWKPTTRCESCEIYTPMDARE